MTNVPPKGPPRGGLSPQEREQLNSLETQEWLDSLAYVLANAGDDRAAHLLEELDHYAYFHGAPILFKQNTPYINTIDVEAQPEYPGNLELERKIRNAVRWNAVVMVLRANKRAEGIGGHLATYASSTELYEVGFNHFFRGHGAGVNRDLIFFQGHASPGIYARSFLEGRFSEAQMNNFRRELSPDGPGLSSYPHPWLMPHYWEFPTVSMGLGPIQAIYQARYIKYLENRGLKARGDAKVWAFLGDGEMDEPQSVGALRFAAYENLDNIVFVLNANLQRLDGPVRANSKVIQEFEALFRGAGWNVIKVVWDSKWDELLAKDYNGAIVKRFEALVDGESQRYAAFGGKELREKFFNTPELQSLIEGWTDADLELLNRGGHDVKKVFAAYDAAVKHQGQPTVIIARTVKGYGLGETAQARNVAHQVKKLDFHAMKDLRDLLELPLTDEQVEHLDYYNPGPDSPEIRYMLECRAALGGFVPERIVEYPRPSVPTGEFYEEFAAGSKGRAVSTTMAAVQIMSKLLRDKEIGKYIVPIVPDEARTFGMDALVPRIGIYSPRGQTYTPVDSGSLMVYKEAVNGQMLEEGLTEDGAMSSWIAAATAYANHGVPTIPFYVFYSMFGMQRIGDLVWAAADQRARGFLFGATAGRTTLAGEGLQHQDGNSLLQAYVVPNLKVYDPAFAYELAVIVEAGIQRMYVDNIDEFYYVTIDNENEVQPPMPEDGRSHQEIHDGILKGMYRFQKSGAASDGKGKAKLRAQILASGPAMGAALEAVQKLEAYGVAADVWSVTSYKELHQDALLTQRHNMLHPTEEPRVSYVARQLSQENAPGVLISVSDYVKLGADGLNGHLDRKLWTLGTDGFGRSEDRPELRDFFEVDARYVTLATLYALQREGKIKGDVVAKAIADLGIDPEREAPVLR
ncbi:pyruvate dehydrogenase (acetyl-transferring), homodimeric type [Deinococcus metallilatus]|uniref:Pyruvate dehydrogenase E1 component n=1 Tax=Deinococcus metallilatus TaxID=1211322 RepID=A0AAJ5F1G6_9DEIO|nr:pyruvate dehydrogenase (acetyl-transferring), homodimeric type [Deinococcus metallilatus]MBB5297244.1 pyruvate dehydrogenase E1 component [Deinococcus metallilatus]QBY09662.1 pyruvate dehydrogenase (acetyl-transferring), homodimeric type [Deinococcus metallilatus]RXJ09034.1 pyruvate dehydrogenase (acetyl-transferring), homodimeric type [Deinococcus metallilatus]TLK21289.1 pyruvate dehydrogenase (acetyl-transferring), homodimeric type [Deinococcus metallilatus]GMA17187.1 pyruvate dehydrogena